MLKYKLLLIFIVNLISFNVTSQKTIEIKSSGYGASETEAIRNAKRDAIEQLGLYISSRTSVQNDELVSDEMSLISSGEILGHKLLHNEKISDNEFFVVIEAEVSESQLAKYFSRDEENTEIRFDGENAKLNLKILEVNKASEVESIKNLVQAAEGYLNRITNYRFGEPYRNYDENNKKVEIEYEVFGEVNINIVELSSLVINSLNKIALDKPQRKKLKEYGRSEYKYKIYSGNTGTHEFYFRNPESIDVINGFSNKIKYSYSDFNLLINNSSDHQYKKTQKGEAKHKLFNSQNDLIGIWSFKKKVSQDELGKEIASIDRKNVSLTGMEEKDSAKEAKRKLNKLIRQANRTNAISVHVGAGMNYFGVSELNYFVENYTFYSPGDTGAIEYFDINPNFISFESATFMLSTGFRFYEFVDFKLSYSFGKSDIGSPSPSGIESNFSFNNLDASGSLILFDSSKSFRPFGGLSYGIMTALELNQYYNGGLINLTEKQSFNYYGINAGFIFSNNKLYGLELKSHLVYSLGGDINVKPSISLELSYNF